MSRSIPLVEQIHKSGQELIRTAVHRGVAATYATTKHTARMEAAREMFLEGWSQRVPMFGNGLTYIKLSRREVIRALEAFDVVVYEPRASQTRASRFEHWVAAIKPDVMDFIDLPESRRLMEEFTTEPLKMTGVVDMDTYRAWAADAAPRNPDGVALTSIRNDMPGDHLHGQPIPWREAREAMHKSMVDFLGSDAVPPLAEERGALGGEEVNAERSSFEAGGYRFDWAEPGSDVTVAMVREGDNFRIVPVDRLPEILESLRRVGRPEGSKE